MASEDARDGRRVGRPCLDAPRMADLPRETLFARLDHHQNVLSLQTVQELFNKFFREEHRFFKSAILDTWICDAGAPSRLFGIRGVDFRPMSAPDKETTRKEARKKLEGRFKDLIQRRHDCIHNCDRPRMSPQPLSTSDTVLKVIQDVQFLVSRCNDHINVEFRQFLVRMGCSAATAALAGYA